MHSATRMRDLMIRLHLYTFYHLVDGVTSTRQGALKDSWGEVGCVPHGSSGSRSMLTGLRAGWGFRGDRR